MRLASAMSAFVTSMHALYEQMDSLSDEDQQALIVLMDSLVKRSQMTRLMTS